MYDAVVIGAGPGGYPCAIRLGQLGMKVAIVEERDLGGVCLNVGCIPSKALIHAAEVLVSAREAEAFGISFEGVKIDLEKLVDWKNSIVKRLTKGVGGLLKAAGVEIVSGRGRIAGRGKVQVGDRSLETRNIVIATGSRPIELPFLRVGNGVMSSTEALELKSLPPRLIVIGGGVIGLELGQVYARLGSQVTVVEALDQLLLGTDPELVKVLRKKLEKEGMRFQLQTRAAGLERSGGVLKLAVSGPDGSKTLKAESILLSIGRRPNTEDLGLATAGVMTDKRGFLEVDEHLRVGEGIYAIGDVVPGALLAHRATKHGLLAANSIAGKDGLYDVRAMPGAVYTVPEIATVGLSEAEAKEQGIEVRIGRFPLAASGRALTQGAGEGLVKLIARADDDTLLGVGVVGPHASELIAEAALCLEMGGQAQDLALTVHPHPTLSEAIMECAEASHGMAVHIPTPKR